MAGSANPVEIVGVGKRYGLVDVLTDVHLTVAPGEKVAIIGPSGSGKTTLLRCVAHLERPTSGHVEIAGERIGQKLVRDPGARAAGSARLPGSAPGIGMVFQRFNLFPHLTVLDNVMLGPTQVLKQSRAAAEPLARELLGKVGAGAQGRRLSRAPVRRPAAARGHCPLAGHAAQADAV